MKDRDEKRNPRLVLTWPLHQRFMAYVAEQVPDAEITCGMGAFREANGNFSFPKVDEGEPEVLRFRGVVQITGHGGMLDLRIKDPSIERRGVNLVLTVIDSFDDNSRIDFADMRQVSPVEDTEGGSRYAAKINAFSSQEMGGVYAPGSDMADIIVRACTQFDERASEPKIFL